MITRFLQWIALKIKQNTCWHDYETVVCKIDNCYPSSWEKCKKCGYIIK